MRGFMAVAISSIFVLILSVQVGHASGVVGNDQADLVYGQPSMFTVTCLAPSATSLCGPTTAAVDSAGNLWVSDALNYRVVMYPPGSTTATLVLGQPNLNSNTRHNGDPSASNMDIVRDLVVDGNGTLFVGDGVNNRILVFFHAAEKSNGAAADLVLGQPNFTSRTPNNPDMSNATGADTCPDPAPASQCTLESPYGLTVDRFDDLLVTDGGNNRVLLWPAADFDPSGSTNCATACYIPATQSWGQFGSFATDSVNEPHTNGGASDPCPTNSAGFPSQCTLNDPDDVATDAQDDLFIADQINHRVLEYDNAVAPGHTPERQDATMVYGQAGSFTSISYPSTTSANSLTDPSGVMVDGAGNLWVNDEYRVLEYPPPVSLSRSTATTAIGVLGQHGSFTTNDLIQGGQDAGTVALPFHSAADAAGDVFVADSSNNRVLEFLQPYPIVARVALAAGWNLVAIADTAQLPYTGSSVVQQIDNQGGSAAEVAVFSGGAYQVFVPGFSTNFGISPKQGVWVLSGGDVVWAQS